MPQGREMLWELLISMVIYVWARTVQLQTDNPVHTGGDSICIYCVYISIYFMIIDFVDLHIKHILSDNFHILWAFFGGLE